MPRTRRSSTRHLPLLTVGIATTAGCLLAAPAAGAVPWSAPSFVPSALPGDAATAQRSGAGSAVATDGTTWISWVQSVPTTDGRTVDSVRAARRDADGRWSGLVEVARNPRATRSATVASVRGTVVFVDAEGRPHLAWAADDGTGAFVVRTASMRADGTWSPPAERGPELSGNGGYFDSSLASHAMADGRVAVAWRDADAVRTVFVARDGTWGPTETVSTNVASAGDVPFDLDLASDAEDRLTVLWLGAAEEATGFTRTLAATRSTSGSWSAPVVIAPGADPDYVEDGEAPGASAHLAADADGTLVATWAVYGAVRVATRAPNASSWSVDDRPAVSDDPERLAPDVVIDRHGVATLVWAEETSSGHAIRSQVRRPGGQWSEPVTVFEATGNARPAAPRAVVGDAGTVTAVWTDRGVSSPRTGRLTAATRPTADGPWDAPVELTPDVSGSGAGADLHNSVDGAPDDLAADPLGDVVVPVVGTGSARTADAVAPRVLDLELAPPSRLDWSARWLPGTLNLRTFVRYLRTDPQGGAFPSAGATAPVAEDPWGYRLQVVQDRSYRDASTGETVVGMRGTLQLAMPTHHIDTRIVDPTVVIAPDGRSAKVVADGQGSGQMDTGATETKAEPFSDVHLLDLDLARSGPRRATDGTTTWIRASATVASPEAQRYLTYAPGSLYGDWTLSVPTALPVRNAPVPAPGGAVTAPPSGAAVAPGAGAVPQPTPSPSPAPPVTAPRPATPTAGALTAKVAGGTRARRSVVVRLSRAVASSATRTYRIEVRRGNVLVAKGTLRGRTLRLTARNLAKRGGKARYARVTGALVVRTPDRIDGRRPSAKDRITSARVTFR